MPEGFGFGLLSNFMNMAFNLGERGLGGLIDQAFYKSNLDYQVGKQKELIDYQNEYNSPTEQMKRLAAAGLNPNLVYGSAAPAGISGNASAPAGHSPAGFGTYDVAKALVNLQQMKQSESVIDLNKAEAENYRAQARYTNGMADRYNELVDMQINEANARINEAASRMDLNASTVQVQAADIVLKQAETAYRNGEIDLQKYRRQEVIAQTELYRSQSALHRTQDYYADVEGQMQVLELEYQKLFYDANGGMKVLSEAERKALENQFRLAAGKSAAVLGIESNEVTKWIDWILSQAGKIFGGAGTAAVAAGMTRNKTLKVIK